MDHDWSLNIFLHFEKNSYTLQLIPGKATDNTIAKIYFNQKYHGKRKLFTGFSHSLYDFCSFQCNSVLVTKPIVNGDQFNWQTFNFLISVYYMNFHCTADPIQTLKR